jgi:hypothetical protein
MSRYHSLAMKLASVTAMICLLVCSSVVASPHDDTHTFQRGICYASTWRNHGDDGYGSATSLQTLNRLRRLGVEWISVTPFGFMESAMATEIHISSHSIESDTRLQKEVAQAHGLGMKVTLKPHVWLRGGDWPGAIKWENDEAWRRWFASYRSFVLHYAALAERDHYDLFVLGTELKSATACDQQCWRALITEVRQVFHGPITYAANWDEAEHVPFWDALDYIGVDEYAPLAKSPGAAELELCTAWNVLAKNLEALSRRTGKRIILTELGYRATRDAAMAPATWPEKDARPKFDPEHQASCFRAALKTLWGKSWLAGIYVWKWFTDSRDEQGPTDFSFADKPAESVMGDFYRRDFR